MYHPVLNFIAAGDVKNAKDKRVWHGACPQTDAVNQSLPQQRCSAKYGHFIQACIGHGVSRGSWPRAKLPGGWNSVRQAPKL